MAADAEQRAPFTCLVADDSQFARRNISGIIAKMGGTVIGEAADGIEAVELYTKLRPDIVVLDITMPQLDGIGTLGRIMQQDRNAKVVIISALGNKDMVWKAITLGAKSFITKPYTPEYAVMIIEDVLRGAGGGRKPGDSSISIPLPMRLCACSRPSSDRRCSAAILPCSGRTGWRVIWRS